MRIPQDNPPLLGNSKTRHCPFGNQLPLTLGE